jgi:hypothetical protein
LFYRIVSPAHTTNISPDKSETDKTRMEMQDWLQMSSIPSSTVILKNEDGSDITQDVDVLVWWTHLYNRGSPNFFFL